MLIRPAAATASIKNKLPGTVCLFSSTAYNHAKKKPSAANAADAEPVLLGRPSNNLKVYLYLFNSLIL